MGGGGVDRKDKLAIPPLKECNSHHEGRKGICPLRLSGCLLDHGGKEVGIYHQSHSQTTLPCPWTRAAAAGVIPGHYVDIIGSFS